MRIVRYGLSLFGLTAVLTGLLLNTTLVLFFTGPGWLFSGAAMISVWWVLIFAVPVALWATFAAWRWRRRAVLDGMMLMAAIGLAIALLLSHSGDGRFRYVSEMYAWGGYLLGLPSAVVAYLASLFLLRRSPLLALVEEPKDLADARP